MNRISPAPTLSPTLSESATSVLLVGDWQQREFAAVREEIPVAQQWHCIGDLSAASLSAQKSEHPPELFFLAQPFPGMYEQVAIDELQRQFPLSRIVVVAGSWCEGELRTGTPLQGVIRLYWYELARWWQAATRRREAGLCPTWSEPLDHPQAGRWTGSQPLTQALTSSDKVLIDAPDYSVYETLSAALKSFEIGAAWAGNDLAFEEGCQVSAGIWDGGQLSQSELWQLKEFCERIDVPVIVLLDFPRREHIQQVHKAGAKAVFGKPYIVEEVVAALAD